MIINFRQWLLLRENFNPAAYDALFDKELAAILPTLRNPDERERLASMQGWTNYIAACLRNAGFRQQSEIEERIHDVVVKLLISPGGLFRNYVEGRSPLDLRFKRSVSNAVKNIVAKENNRKKFFRPVPLHADFYPEDLPARPEQNDDATMIDGFRNLLQTRLGDLAVALFTARLEGRQTRDLVGLPELDHPSQYLIKRTVREIKNAARDYSQSLGDPDFLRRVEQMLDAAARTVARRVASTQQRRVEKS